ncbi:CpaF family protein [Carnobacterium divergens]|uniref:Pilus assembly protein n=2 Tax=Carnobacterium divergens TaxID=2748 RepID=A0A7Z8D163_CARDV|nr:CpaF family protein [Carnobacterium divergens]TFI73947.1 pilus assembly protein [Carnobacterium divergens]TFI77917.1 pilus assembly protein [Carnobacterium divergens]TFI84758.1 pilus assembly protein [Carnobacterium divergens]TFI96797.1 pilus assembly protein [Carnobacterium divergens]TFJ12744.1 pilus assembly protein [Carnobacterium divergens]
MVDESVIKNLMVELRATLDFMHSIGDEEMLEYVESAVFDYAAANNVKSKDVHRIIERIYHAFRGLDALQPLLDDREVSEIMINNHEEIFIEKRGEVFQSDLKFESQEKLEDIIQSIVSKVNRIVNESSPIVDARLKDGSRVNIVLPPIALKGPVMTIRKFPERALTIDDFVNYKSITPEVAHILEKLVRARYNIFISGGTGSGKTTFLNVMSNFIPGDERIITIEDSAELQISSVPNLVSLETRNANTEGKGEISIRELIKSSLRMRPDRVVVGEVRGEEALDMLQAMNTGHDGSLSTGHSNSTYDMLSRLETMVLTGANLPVEVIRQQISSAVDIMVHLSRMRDHTRKVVEVTEVLGFENGEIQLNPLFKFVEEGEYKGKIVGELKATGNELVNHSKLAMAGIQLEKHS